MESIGLNQINTELSKKEKFSSSQRIKRKVSDSVTIDDLRANWTQCHFFLPLKRRLCNIGRVTGSLYCGNHRPVDDPSLLTSRRKYESTPSTISVNLLYPIENNGTSCDDLVSQDTGVSSDGLSQSETAQKAVNCLPSISNHSNKRQRRGNDSNKRVPCPVDPSHSIYACNLESHSKICTATTRSQRLLACAYYRRDCNSGRSTQNAMAVDPDHEADYNKQIHRYDALNPGERPYYGENQDKDEPDSTSRRSQAINATMTGLDESQELNRIDAIEDMNKSIVPIDCSRQDKPQAHGIAPVIDESEPTIDPDELMRKIICLFEDEVKNQIELPCELPPSHPFYALEGQVYDQMALNKTTFNGSRHIKQDLAIVHQMIGRGLLDITKESDQDMFVEFGAGKGLLGLVISSFLPKASIVLVERSGVRQKADRSLRLFERRFHRVRMDIRDCFLPGLFETFKDSQSAANTDEEVDPSRYDSEEAISEETKQQKATNEDKRMVLTAKHLCGVATDLALHGVSLFLTHSPSPSYSADHDKRHGNALRGVAIATCCHHACNWNDYVGRDWIESKGITRHEFKILCQWSGWQSLINTKAMRQPKDEAAIRQPKAQETLLDDKQEDVEQSMDHQSNAYDIEMKNEETHNTPPFASSTAPRPRNITAEEMLSVGRMCKQIIDHGRVQYLRGFVRYQVPCEASQQVFCDSSLSPECVLITARIS